MIISGVIISDMIIPGMIMPIKAYTKVVPSVAVSRGKTAVAAPISSRWQEENVIISDILLVVIFLFATFAYADFS